MDYSQFSRIIQGGEKFNIDFKIKCDAFYGKDSFADNAELAKDICAMANNGNVASYIIIGVSDDAKNYLSVQNSKLTDDALQDFCKKNIFPPPKVNLSRITWKRTSIPGHKDKEFIIIQVGPQPRKAFRISTDFILYDKQKCYRRNEVWLRRNATSDLATPEEIANLVVGKSAIESQEVIELNRERHDFEHLSFPERKNQINESIINLLVRKNKYKKIKPKTQPSIISYKSNLDMRLGWYERQLSKGLVNSICIINVADCLESITKNELIDLGSVNRNFKTKNDLPAELLKMIGDRSVSIREIFIIPILASIPKSRIHSGLSHWNYSGNNKHFYGKIKKKWGETRDLLPTSSEIIILDNLLSISDMLDKLQSTITYIEPIEITIYQPEDS